jgi:hypothetical protein
VKKESGIMIVSTTPSELDIFRRIVDADQLPMSVEAAHSLLRLRFSSTDQRRMNHLALKNRQGRIQPEEEKELNNFLRAGQVLGILQSKARQALMSVGQTPQRVS